MGVVVKSERARPSVADAGATDPVGVGVVVKSEMETGVAAAALSAAGVDKAMTETETEDMPVKEERRADALAGLMVKVVFVSVGRESAEDEVAEAEAEEVKGGRVTPGASGADGPTTEVLPGERVTLALALLEVVAA